MKLITKWLRRIGLARFGYAQENFAHHHQLLRVWGPLISAHWEVYRWPLETGSSDMDEWMKPLPFGSIEAYHRIQLSAELVYSGDDWDVAQKAFAGSYPDGTTDRTRPQLPEKCPRCRREECSPECIAAEQAELDAYKGPSPRKFA